MAPIRVSIERERRLRGKCDELVDHRKRFDTWSDIGNRYSLPRPVDEEDRDDGIVDQANLHPAVEDRLVAPTYPCLPDGTGFSPGDGLPASGFLARAIDHPYHVQPLKADDEDRPERHVVPLLLVVNRLVPRQIPADDGDAAPRCLEPQADPVRVVQGISIEEVSKRTGVPRLPRKGPINESLPEPIRVVVFFHKAVPVDVLVHHVL